VKKFFKDIEEQHDDKLGFESEVDNLRAEVNRPNKEHVRSHTELLQNTLIGPALLRLLESGVKEEHIIAAVTELLNINGRWRQLKQQRQLKYKRKYDCYLLDYIKNAAV
jgi:hypothetical protein